MQQHTTQSGPRCGEAAQRCPVEEQGLFGVSVFDLVQRARALEGGYFAVDERKSAGKLTPKEVSAFEDSQRICDDHVEALRALALTMPAVTLGDAAGQIALGFVVSEVARCEVLTADEARVEFLKLHRIMASCLPIVAKAAGIDLVALAGDHMHEYCAREFLMPDVCGGGQASRAPAGRA